LADKKQNPPETHVSGGFLFFCDLAGGGSDGVGSLVEGVLDFAAQKGQNGNNNESDQRDEKTVLNEGLALFFLEKACQHGGWFTS
jgi:hypothetical protein